ncbi:MAG: class I SAM-dependent methyltransferase [Deltaproteobacteria bacterium]|nr:class I SAM-dependent methyltransferase [Deltaproteobacteria bacterium]
MKTLVKTAVVILLAYEVCSLCGPVNLSPFKPAPLSDEPLHWQSQHLDGNFVPDVVCASHIISSVAENSGLRNELARFLETKFGGMKNLRTNPHLWSLYLRLYDIFTTSSDGYPKLISFVDDHFARTGWILDAGAGTGTFSAALAMNAPARRFLLIDSSAEGLAIAEKKFRYLEQTGRPKEFTQFLIANLLDPPGFGVPVQAALMNNVLYSIPKDNQDRVLRLIYDSLPKGGTFILSDPSSDFIKTSYDLETVIHAASLEAFQNGAQATDYELALATYINLEVLAGKVPPFVSSNELVCKARAAGFKVKQMTTTLYYGINTVLVLEK